MKNKLQYGKESNHGDFWIDFAARVAIVSQSYDNLIKDVTELETLARCRIGGIPNIGNPELQHRICILDHIAEEHLKE